MRTGAGKFMSVKAIISLSVLTLLCSVTQAQNAVFASSSVLSAGTWFRAAVTAEGVYRIDYSKLRDLGLQNPGNPRIYASNRGQLSFYNDGSAPDDLGEIPVLVASGSDGIFNEGDYLLFYASAPGRWKYDNKEKDYDYIKHFYSDTAFYFITSSSTGGKRVSQAPETALQENYQSNHTDLLYRYENDVVNLLKSGRDWFEEIISLRINPAFSGLSPGEPVGYRMRVAAQASVSTVFRILEGQNTLKSLQVQPVNVFTTTGTYAQVTDSAGSFMTASQSPQFDIRFFNNGENSARGWIDFLVLKARKASQYSGQQFILRDSRSAAPGRVTRFTVNSQLNDVTVWDITDPENPLSVQVLRTSDALTFKSVTDTLKTYAVFQPSSVVSPLISKRPVRNQDLHASAPADMIIVSHPLFLAQAARLASMHRNESGLESLIVTPEQIYNEFSGGIPDIAAIRNFIRMKYLKQKNSGRPLRYLLLFGDGSYENKTPPPANPNFVPTYQSINSNVIVSSFTSDDFYGLLDDGEGEADGTEDIGIGRLPVTDTLQAGIILSKIKKYMNGDSRGDWKNVICLTADDEDGNIHMSDAEGLSALLTDSVPQYKLEKIYLDAFRQVTSANGQSYPDATRAINDRINAGCLIFNYIGHGNEISLAHEGVIKTDGINSWKNGSKLPLFITATCEFSRFDDAEYSLVTKEFIPKTSAGEMVLLNPDGGSVALMSTTRVVYSAPNYTLNRNILDVAFDRDEEGRALRLGDIIRIAKNLSGSGPNKRNFLLLGDPALRLSYPWQGRVVTDSLNRRSVSEPTDSLKALSLISITGHIEDNKGLTMNDFNGTVWPVVYDKMSSVRTLANDGGLSMEFFVRNNVLFSGKTKAENGRFSFTFLVPRDIDYTSGKGAVSYYAAGDSKEMNGIFDKITVGGFESSLPADTSGPAIWLFMNDTLFRNGGITDSNPRLLAILCDKGGINTTGAGIGHDITGYLDGDLSSSVILNSYFENDFDTYSRGRVMYDLTGLKEGSHSLTLKAWDNFNNSASETIHFVVRNEPGFILTNLLNYPNPFSERTSITAGHNRPGEELDVRISIYSAGGEKIRILKSRTTAGGYALEPIIWDGTAENGSRAARGLYIYSVTVTTPGGESATASGRIVIL